MVEMVEMVGLCCLLPDAGLICAILSGICVWWCICGECLHVWCVGVVYVCGVCVWCVCVCVCVVYGHHSQLVLCISLGSCLFSSHRKSYKRPKTS